MRKCVCLSVGICIFFVRHINVECEDKKWDT